MTSRVPLDRGRDPPVGRRVDEHIDDLAQVLACGDVQPARRSVRTANACAIGVDFLPGLTVPAELASVERRPLPQGC